MRASARGAFALATAPTISLQCELARLVSFAALNQKTPPAFLYTSGKPGRFNPADVDCVYFSESEETARAEYEAAFAVSTAGVSHARHTSRGSAWRMSSTSQTPGR